MGRPSAVTRASAPPAPAAVTPTIAERALAAALLLPALPLLGLIAALIRLDSNGPAFERRSLRLADGSPVELFAFRTVVDGAATTAHIRVRSVVGATEDAQTRMGRLVVRARMRRLPRLINVIAGHVPLRWRL